MDETEWLQNADPQAMLLAVGSILTRRKLRLFLVGCARSDWDRLLRDDLRRAVEVGEQVADSESQDALLEEQNSMLYGFFSVPPIPGRSGWVDGQQDRIEAWSIAKLVTFRQLELTRFFRTTAWQYGRGFARSSTPNLLRCVFGNPFRPVALDPTWRTEAVVALAAGVYADRAFERLPVLADALEDAGCANADVLAHCRGDGPHARGCWVVDLLLGKA